MRGVVIGKFLPLHVGHLHLIRSALERCDRVTAIVGGSRWEEAFIPAQARAHAIQECFPEDFPARLTVRWDNACAPDPYDERTWDHWVGWTRERAPSADALFTSESYGDEFARRLGMAHVCVDAERRTFPVSGTACRLNPHARWEDIAPPMRPYFLKRVVLIGAESTGKSTLAERLAVHYGTEFVPETGRTFLEAKGEGRGKALCERGDLLTIAELHMEAERESERKARRVLFLDTDLSVTDAFGQYYFGGYSGVRELANLQAPRYHLHLLCSPEVPWEDDGTRDCTQADREWFDARYQSEMRWRRQPFVKLPANRSEAFHAAVEAVDRLLAAP